MASEEYQEAMRKGREFAEEKRRLAREKRLQESPINPRVEQFHRREEPPTTMEKLFGKTKESPEMKLLEAQEESQAFTENRPYRRPGYIGRAVREVETQVGVGISKVATEHKKLYYEKKAQQLERQQQKALLREKYLQNLEEARQRASIQAEVYRSMGLNPITGRPLPRSRRVILVRQEDMDELVRDNGFISGRSFMDAPSPFNDPNPFVGRRRTRNFLNDPNPFGL